MSDEHPLFLAFCMLQQQSRCLTRCSLGLDKIFQICRTQIILLIILSFLNDKTEYFTGKYQEIKISRLLKTIFEEKNIYQSWEYSFFFREQRCTQNLVKHMKWRDLQNQLMVKSCKIFVTHSILDILQGLEYPSGGDLPLFFSPFRETQ